MAGLVCDICGGSLAMGAGGIASCSVCGMAYSSERIREKVQELNGGVVTQPVVTEVNINEKIDNYMELAKTAKNSGNNEEALNYCNKVLELNPNHSFALLLKGEAIIWESTTSNNRLDEGIVMFKKAIEHASDDYVQAIIDEVKNQIESVLMAILSLHCNRFAKWPDKEECNGVLVAYKNIISMIPKLIGTGVYLDTNDLQNEGANKINSAVVNAWNNVVWKDYRDEQYPSEHDFDRVIAKHQNCRDLLIWATTMSDGIKNIDNITRYENLIYMEKLTIDVKSYKYEYSEYGSGYRVQYTLTKEAQQARRNQIQKWEEEIVKTREFARKLKIEEYWKNHAEEKKALDKELENNKAEQNRIIKECEEKVAKVNEERTASTELSQLTQEVKTIDEQIQKLESEKKGLGLFKGKEKKEITDKIYNLSSKKTKLQHDSLNINKRFDDQVDSIKNEYRSQLTSLRKREKEITTELTKDR